MLKGKWRLFICIALVACVIFSASNNVFAAINTSYGSGDEVEDEEINDKVKSSSLLEAIGSLIFSLGSLIEKLTSKVFRLVTGSATFPWADAILFNAVPFLDINIFSADKSSLIYVVKDTLTGTYYSLLTLASTFFGIAVMFSAVKLVITAMAEDKAKYKKAIVDWLLGLVMLWGMHFFMSFVLYLNEELVRVARSIATTSMNKYGNHVGEKATEEEAKKVVDLFIGAMEEWRANTPFVGLAEMISKYDEGNYSLGVEESKKMLRDNPFVAWDLLKSQAYRDWRFGESKWYNGKAWDGETNNLKSFFTECSTKMFIQVLAVNVNAIVNDSKNYWDNFETEYNDLRNKKDKTDDDNCELRYRKLMLDVYNKYNDSSSGASSASDSAVVANLAQYFKETAWTRGAKSWKNTKISISSAILYVIFVCYSIVFFISYTKRLFYVIILMMMAPIVVVFDFFVKFGK